MGTEVLIFLIPIPFIFWLRNLWQLTKIQTRTKAALNLLCGLVFVGYFCLPYESYQNFMQGLIFGGLLYIPFYVLVSWLLEMILEKYNQWNGR
ncbi:hypothetical protein A5320_19875 [Rheinheimera sp. SA_1]|jgi:hypothetical protein|nr:hypothetical protein A5320_19875 [Rheinheimera sp. SA_1]